MFFIVRGSFVPIFTKKYLYLSPLEFFENENFDARAPKLRIWTSKIMPDLWLLDLFCPIKKNSTLHPTVHHCLYPTARHGTASSRGRIHHYFSLVIQDSVPKYCRMFFVADPYCMEIRVTEEKCCLYSICTLEKCTIFMKE